MASLSSILAIVLLSVYYSTSNALQVAPNSPCASVCVDSNDLDHSDPNSSNTLNKDISCHDKDYANTASGQKFRRCLSCLQDSTFSQGSETDQGWFLYNLRYTFDYCIFGYPNATGIESTPCSTSTACGGLESALTGDELHVARGLEPYGFCAADGGAMIHSETNIQKCVSCVSASQDQKYLANYMVALQAGCTQQPAPGTAIGLNDTVFSSTRIGMVDPKTSAAASGSHDEKPVLATPALVGIAIGGAVVLLGIAGLIFVRQRTRRNRRQRLAASLNGDAPNSRRKQGHRPASSLSFRCQTHLSPRSPNFFHNMAESVIQEEKQQRGPSGSNPINSASPSSYVSPYWSPTIAPSSGFRSGERSYGRGGPDHLQNITTSAPTVPDHVHYSTSPKAKGFSPIDTATPASAVSTKSTAQLLPTISYTYNPADYGVARPQVGANHNNTHHNSPYSDHHHTGHNNNSNHNNNNNHYASPTSASTASPLLSRAWEQQSQRSWDPLPPRPSVNVGNGGANRSRQRLPAVKVSVGGGTYNKGKRGSNTGSPVESEEIKVSFAGPPR